MGTRCAPRTRRCGGSSGPATRRPTGHELFERLSADLHDVVPHDGAVWFGADPVTLLATSPVRVEALDGVELRAVLAPRVPRAGHRPVRRPGPRARTRLRHSGSSLDGRPARSARYRELLRAAGLRRRAAGRVPGRRRTPGACSGLYREHGRDPVHRRTRSTWSRQLSPIIAGRAPRPRAGAEPVARGRPAHRGSSCSTSDSRVVSANAEALGWLRELLPDAAELGGDVRDAARSESVEELLASDEVDRQISPLWALLSRSRALGRRHRRSGGPPAAARPARPMARAARLVPRRHRATTVASRWRS